ncbi:lipocalin-like domain-containing protein [Microscilla marina]|nr:lipocalin family protein [Microscilla marina]
MKYLNGILMLVMLVAFTACGGSGDPKATLTSTPWALDIDAAMKDMPKEQLEKMPKAMLEKITEGLKKTRFNFKKDGTMEMTGGPMGKSLTGSWKLSDDGKTLTMTQGEGGEAIQNKIVELSSKKLVFEADNNGKKTKAVLVPAK